MSREARLVDWPSRARLRRAGGLARRVAGEVGLFVVFTTLVTPSGVIYRLLRRRRDPGWRTVTSSDTPDRFYRPW